MQVTCTQENLSLALSSLERVVGRQSSLPILSNFLFETEKGRLKVSGTNLEIGIVVRIGAKIESEGKLAVPAKVLSQFVHNIPSGEVVSLKSSGVHLEVESGRYKIRIKVLDGKDFPIIPEHSGSFPISLPAPALKQALSRLLFCVSLNEARIELTGVQFTFTGESLEIAATDSFRLAEETLPLEGGEKPSEGTQVLLPSPTLQELVRILQPTTEEVRISIDENQIFFEVENIHLVSRLIHGKLPDYKQILPKNFSFEGSVEKSELLRSLKIASGLSSFTAGEIAVILDPTTQSCTLVSKSQEVGESTNTLPLTLQSGNESLTLIFNPRYFQEGISALPSEKITIFANTNTSPVMLREEGRHEGYFYLLMPIKKEYA